MSDGESNIDLLFPSPYPFLCIDFGYEFFESMKGFFIYSELSCLVFRLLAAGRHCLL